MTFWICQNRPALTAGVIYSQKASALLIFTILAVELVGGELAWAAGRNF